MANAIIKLKVSRAEGGQFASIRYDEPFSAEFLAPRVLAVAKAIAARLFPDATVIGELTDEYCNSIIYGSDFNEVSLVAFNMLNLKLGALVPDLDEAEHKPFSEDDAERVAYAMLNG